MPTDFSEKALEELIIRSLVDEAGYLQGDPHDFDRAHAIDFPKLLAFLVDTQPAAVDRLSVAAPGPARDTFLSRLQGEIAKRGIIDVLRKGVSHLSAHVQLYYATPSPGNDAARARHAKNIFSITRQLRYSRDETQRALDLCIFLNGLPIATFELKNNITKQTVADAVEQYQRDRDPRELLFQFGRCLAHFAVDDAEVRFCTSLSGKSSVFLPFNQGYNDGAGNPPNSNGLKTDYLWKQFLAKPALADILENFAQIVETIAPNGKKKRVQIFPRFHQLRVVHRLLADAAAHGAGKYLIQHSAGSGKSNSIAWLAHQLIGLNRDGHNVFDSIVVVTDRRVLDQQIKATIKHFAQVSATVAHADSAADLRRYLAEGKKIIISTVQKFPFILEEIGDEHRQNNFAIIIDEAHSSQGGRTSGAIGVALAEEAGDDDLPIEDKINHLIASHRLLTNASYFAFTATPKNKTLEMFGDPIPAGDKVKHRPFDAYTMKQAIEEGFILDVLKSYTPVASYYRLIKAVADDPEFDTKKAQKKLRRYVEGHSHAIRQKVEIIVDHFHQGVIAKRKIGGRARAMIVTSGIDRALQYFFAFRNYLAEIKSPYQAIVAFSGEHEYAGAKVSESSLNGFPSSQIADRIQQDPYRFLIVADKFQTGYDEPLLHTMYVDKILSGIKAVQTLSRLNRACPQKHDTFILDFANDTASIQQAFADYYQTTILSEETDPNKLHDLQSSLDAAQIYTPAAIDSFVALFLASTPREQLDPILDICAAAYRQLDEDAQVNFKGSAKAFVRTYGFLATVLPFNNPAWEKRSIFLNFLIPKLPAPKEEDLSKGLIETIDMDSYRAEVQAAQSIALPPADAEIGPVPAASGAHRPEPQIDRLSNILKDFNDRFGHLDWGDNDKIRKIISEDLPKDVAADLAYRNAIQNSDPQNARIEHDQALKRIITALVNSNLKLYQNFNENDSFKNWLADTIFKATYTPPPKSSTNSAR